MRVLLAALTTVVPWIPAVPAPTPHPALARPCAPAKLQVQSFPARQARGWLVAGIVLRNRGPACSLVGRPTLQAAPKTRVKETPLLAGHVAAQDRAPDALPPRFSLRSLPKGGEVYLGFQWQNWCAKARPRFTALLPRGGRIALPAAATPAAPCSKRRSPFAVEVGHFVQWDPPPARSTHLPFAVAFAQPAFRARSGSVLRYDVTLRNTGSRAYTFHGCPSYREGLVNAKHPSTEQHILNCRAARTFAPGQTRTFAMRLRIPRNNGGEPAAIFFELGLGTYLPVSVPVRKLAVVTIS